MVPPISDPRWRSVVTGTIVFEPMLLATQILMKRLEMSLKVDPSPANLERAVADLRAFYDKYERIAARDLSQIFG